MKTSAIAFGLSALATAVVVVPLGASTTSTALTTGTTSLASVMRAVQNGVNIPDGMVADGEDGFTTDNREDGFTTNDGEDDNDREDDNDKEDDNDREDDNDEEDDDDEEDDEEDEDEVSFNVTERESYFGPRQVHTTNTIRTPC
jgi:hypothetical protein